jgi:DUF917 family protein
VKLTEELLVDICTGAAFLGTGGGGDPYIGRQMVRQAMEDGYQVNIIDPSEVPDDALVIPTAMMGAPTVLVEKLPRGDEAICSLKRLEKHLGKKAFATMPIEIGGINSTMPLVVGAYLDLPVIDADGMGRAFPELYQETFAVYGISCTPMVISNEYGDTTLIETHDNFMAEWLARGVTIRMGGAAYIAEYPMTGAEVKRTSIHNTLTLAMRIGRCLREARQQHRDPFEALSNLMPQTPYKFITEIYQGKLVDVQRKTSAGFSVGSAQIQGLERFSGLMEITFQNEHLVARVDGVVKAIVPDLICIMDSETAEPITTEALRYGQRVKVLSVSCPPIMRTPEALKSFGPQVFGIEEPFTPIEDLAKQP